MTELEKKAIRDAIAKKFKEEQEVKKKRIIEGYLVNDEGEPATQE